MSCLHGINGICPLCRQEKRRAARDELTDMLLKEMGRLVLDLAENYGVDTSRLEGLLKELP